MGQQLFDPLNPLLDSWSIVSDQQEAMKDALWTGAARDIIPTFNLTVEQSEELLTAYDTLPIPDSAHLYADVVPFFTRLRSKENCPELLLITRGTKGLQQSKLDYLDISKFFDHAEIVGDHREGFSGKREAFEHYLHKLELTGGEVISVGDSAKDELAVGRELGMATVQTLRESVTKDPDAKHHIKSLEELWPIIGRERPAV